MLPFISINISLLRKHNASIVLSSLKHITYPSDRFEVILIEGKHLTKQRNKGINKSKGSIIYLLDDDSIVHSHALHILAKTFSDPLVAAVGGPSLTPQEDSTYFSFIVGCILETYFGAFRMRLKWSKQKTGKEQSDYAFLGSNLALRKKAVIAVGGFDERFQANDETELLRRLKDKGFKLHYNNRLYIYRHQRENIVELARQFHHYGKGRMKHIFKNPKFEDYFLLAPICFEIYLLSLLFYHRFWYSIPLLIYFILALMTSIKAALKYRKPDLFFSMTFLYPIIHISYSFGLLHEFIQKVPQLVFNKTQNSKEPKERIRVRKLQLNLLAS